MWESSSMILPSSFLWTRMLCTDDVSATTTAKSGPTTPKTHSIAAASASSECRACRRGSGFPRVGRGEAKNGAAGEEKDREERTGEVGEEGGFEGEAGDGGGGCGRGAECGGARKVRGRWARGEGGSSVGEGEGVAASGEGNGR